MSWYSKEADDTYRIFGGIMIAVIVVIGLFILHNADTEKDLLSPEHIMGLIALPGVMLSYSVGKKMGKLEAENGKLKGDTEQ